VLTVEVETAATSTKTDWTSLDLIHAANLARLLSDMETEREKLGNEGFIIETEHGRITNPRQKIIDGYLRCALSLCRTIGVDAASTQGRARNQAAKNTALRRMREALDDAEDLDDLLLALPEKSN
jgi:hypothetical protein